jgi:DNA-binding CsgD family transcriptional regulator
MGYVLNQAGAQHDDRLVGRDRELAVLGGAIRAGATGEATAICLDGVPGIGKSTLLTGAAELAREAGYTVLTASASAAEAENPFGVVRQLFEPTGPTDGPDLPPDVVALLRRILDPLATDNAADELAMSHALYRLTVAMSADRPLLIGVDDLDQADLSSLRWLVYLRRRMRRVPIVLVTTTSTGRAATDRALVVEVLAGTQLLAVRPLDPAGCATIAEAAYSPTRVTPEFAAACHDATDGNPFLLRELLRALVDDGVPPDGEHTDRVHRCEPPWLADRLMARLRGQDPQLATLVRVVAVLGTPDLEVAAASADLPVLITAGLAHTLARMGILRAGQRLQLRSAVIGRSVAQDVSPVDQDTTNARAAEFLRANQAAPHTIARHLLATTSVSGDWVITTLCATAKDAVLAGSPEQSVALLTRLLRERLTDELRDGTLLLLAILQAGADIDRVTDQLAAVRGCPARAERLLRIVRAYSASVRGDHADVAADLAMRAWTTPTPGDERVTDICDPGFLPTIELCYVVLTLVFADRIDDALRCCAEITIDNPFVIAMSGALRAFAEYRAGNVTAALSAARSGMETAHRLGPAGWITSAIALPVLVDAAIDSDEIDTARNAVERADLTEEMPEYWRYHFLLHSRAKLDAALGEHEAAVAGYLDCGRVFRDAGIVNPAYCAWRSGAAVLSHQLGRHDVAAELAAEELALARRWGAPRALGVALRAVAIAGRAADPDALLRESADALETAGAQLELCMTLLAHGEWLIAHDRPDSATERLRRAKELAARCGAAALSRQADDALRLAAAGRSAGYADTGLLTPHERRIAGMAVAGMTNRQIAEQLRVTSRTVELHLTKIYRKLDISRRSQLANAMNRTEATVRP